MLQVPYIIRQRKRHVCVARFRTQLATTARDHHKLFASHFVYSRCSECRIWQGGFPEQLARTLIEYPELAIFGRTDKQEPPFRDSGAAIVFGTRFFHAL